MAEIQRRKSLGNTVAAKVIQRLVAGLLLVSGFERSEAVVARVDPLARAKVGLLGVAINLGGLQSRCGHQAIAGEGHVPRATRPANQGHHPF